MPALNDTVTEEVCDGQEDSKEKDFLHGEKKDRCRKIKCG